MQFPSQPEAHPQLPQFHRNWIVTSVHSTCLDLTLKSQRGFLMASSEIVRCSCGRNYNSAVLIRCPACGKDSDNVPANSSTTGISDSSAQENMPRRLSQSATAASLKVTRNAENQAHSLAVVALVVSVIGIIGSVITCMGALFLLGDELSRPIGILLLTSGIAGILIWVFIGTFAQTVAAGVKVLVLIARSHEHSN